MIIKEAELKLSLTILISFFLHIVLFLGLIMPKINDFTIIENKLKNNSSIRGRDIIVNINQDDQKVISRKTLLSDKDSSAKGYITKNVGDRWLNNSLDFKLPSGKKDSGQARKIKVKEAKTTILLSDYSEVVVLLSKEKESAVKDLKDLIGDGGDFDKVLIPDKYDVSKNNALFYSNDGKFSFNTAKFKDFKYFKSMKDKIASNWYPPIMANSVYGGYNPATGGYAPGRTRIMAIPSQEVKLYFIMNRDGDVLKIEILDSLGNRPLNESCIDSIRLSKSFGTVPEDLKGEFIVIPFIFGYYVE